MLSCVAFAVVEAGEDRYASQVVEQYTEEIANGITDRVAMYGNTLTDLAYAVGAQTSLSPDDFARITAGADTERLPGASGVSFIVSAATAQVPAVQRHWRAQGASDLVLDPQPGRTTHDFVIFEKAFDDRADMQGRDVAVSPEVSSVLQTSRRNNGLAVSPAFPLLRDSTVSPAQRQPGVLMAVPVTDQAEANGTFEGWVVMGLRGQDFLTPTLLDRSHSLVQSTVSDVTGAPTVLATATPGLRSSDDDLPEHQRGLAVGQRRWQVATWPTTRLVAGADRGMSELTLAAGATLSFALAVMTFILAGSRNQALERVDRATAALRADITERKLIEAQLRERETQLQNLAFHDPLTGLANRLLFYDRLTHALASHARSGRRFAVLFIDLDGFKKVNDERGHQAGDAVLREVASRLRTGLRADDTVARFGGDEFAVILEGIADETDARPTATRIIDAVQRPVDLPDGPAAVSASVGIAVNRPGATADAILQDADTAMYAAKTAGKNRYVEAALPGCS